MSRFSPSGDEATSLKSQIRELLGATLAPSDALALSIFTTALLSTGSPLSAILPNIREYCGDRIDSTALVQFLESRFSDEDEDEDGEKCPTLTSADPSDRDTLLRRAYDTYESIDLIPVVSRCLFSNDECTEVELTLSHRDFLHNSTHCLTQTYCCSSSDSLSFSAASSSSSRCWRLVGGPGVRSTASTMLHPSPSGRFAVCFTKQPVGGGGGESSSSCSSSPSAALSGKGSGGKKDLLTLDFFSRTEGCLLCRVAVPGGLHGDIITKAPFGTPVGPAVRWGDCPSSTEEEEGGKEGLVLYVADVAGGGETTTTAAAEKKKKTSEEVEEEGEEREIGKTTTTKTKTTTGTNTKSPWDCSKFEFRKSESWGELLSKVRRPRIFICDWRKGTTTATKQKVQVAELPGVPPNLACAQPIFLTDPDPGRREEDTTSIYVGFVGYDTSGPKRGLVYCTQRRCAYYVVKVCLEELFCEEEEGDEKKKKKKKKGENESCWQLTVPEENVSDWWNLLYPRMSPDGSKLIYLTTSRVPFHFSCHKLMSAEIIRHQSSSFEQQQQQQPISLGPPRTIVDVVEEGVGVELPGEDFRFCGLFPVQGLSHACWGGISSSVDDESESEAETEEEWIVLSSVHRCRMSVMCVRLADGKVIRLGLGADCGMDSLSLLDCRNGKILALRRSPCLPFEILLGDVSHLLRPVATTEEEDPPPAVRWTVVVSSNSLMPERSRSLLRNLSYSTHSFVPEHGPQDIPVNIVVIYPPPPENVSESEPKILMYPHGGPHSIFGTNFYSNRTYFAALGFFVVLVNFRGSIGFGNKGIRSLGLDGVGIVDVADVEAARQFFVREVLPEHINHRKPSPLTTSPLFSIAGGSHGGFVVGHALAKFPDLYCCGLSRNGVTNLGAFFATSDIPDWVFSVLGMDPWEEDFVASEEFAALAFRRSPISQVRQIVAPILLHVGAEDRRVPISQSVHFFQALRSLGREVVLKVYPGNSHPLSKPMVRADVCITSAMWLFEHNTRRRRKKDD